MKAEKIYRASDGAPFPTIEECAAHEEAVMVKRLCGLKAGTVGDAISGTNAEVRAAIRFVARMIESRRAKNGEVAKRKPKAVAAS